MPAVISETSQFLAYLLTGAKHSLLNQSLIPCATTIIVSMHRSETLYSTRSAGRVPEHCSNQCQIVGDLDE